MKSGSEGPTSVPKRHRTRTEMHSRTRRRLAHQKTLGQEVAAPSLEAAQEGRDEHSFLSIGEQVDHFRIIGGLGRGGMGDVYLARDVVLGRKVALKLLQSVHLSEEKNLERFMREARMTAKFSHPHIVTVHGVGEHRGVPYVALEFLDGLDLGDRIVEQEPSVQESLRIMRAVASAVAEAHRHGVLHRDLKPENVVIPPDGRLRVVDFGLATVVDGAPVSSRLREADLSDSGAFQGVVTPTTHGGTPAYMAPEQWRAEQQSPATDVWAMGVMLYELLAGELPFDEPSIRQQFAAVCQGPPPPRLDEHHGQLPLVADLVCRCLARNPDDRPEALEVETVLTEALAPKHAARPADQNPFRGLEAFRASQAHMFFGREREIEAFVERARSQSFLVVAGPSGAGKSSFVAAGAVPRLMEQAAWRFLRTRPGSEPFHGLARVLLQGAYGSLEQSDQIDPLEHGISRETVRSLAEKLAMTPGRLGQELRELAQRQGERVLLFVDQLEELVTLVEDQAVRDRFLRALCSAADEPLEPVRVVVTVRDDFLGRLAASSPARDAFNQMVLMQRPGLDALEDTLRKPLEVVGYSYDDPRLPNDMILAVGDEPACLPLLQFTAQQLWEQRDRERCKLLRSAYETMGGVEGALARHANGVVDGLSSDDMKVAKALLLRLVTTDETRRVVKINDALEGLGDAAESVLDQLMQARLLTVRKVRGADAPQATVELVHESLIKRWATLRRWMEEGREELMFLAEAHQAAALWVKRGRRDDELWQGETLREAQHALRHAENIPEQVRRFIEASQSRSRRQARNARLAVIIIVVVLSGVASALALQSRLADEQRDLAEKREVQTLLANAWSAIDREEMVAGRGILRKVLEDLPEVPRFARAGWMHAAEQPLQWIANIGGGKLPVLAVQPNGTLIGAVTNSPTFYFIDRVSGKVTAIDGPNQYTTLDFTPDGKRLVTGTNGKELTVWDVAERKPLFNLETGAAEAVDLRVRPGGKSAVVGFGSGEVRLVDLTGRTPSEPLFDGLVDHIHLKLTPDGQRVWLPSAQGLHLWDIPSRSLVGELRRDHVADWGLLFDLSTDGRRIAMAWKKQTIVLFDTESRKRVGHMFRVDDPLRNIKLSPRGRFIAALTAKRLYVWDLSSGRLLRSTKSLAYSRSRSGLQWDDKERRFFVAALRGVKAFRAPSKGMEVKSNPRHRGILWAVSFSPDGKKVATAGLDAKVLVWDLASGHVDAVFEEFGERIPAIDFHPTRSMMAIGGARHDVLQWDFAKSTTTERYQPGNLVLKLHHSPDGTLMAGSNSAEQVVVWNTDGESAAQVVGTCEGWCKGLSLHPSEKRLAWAGTRVGSPVMEVNLDTMVERKLLDGRSSESIQDLAYLPDGSIAIAGVRRPVSLLNPLTGKERTLADLKCDSYALGVQPGGQRIGVPCNDSNAYLLDVSDGRKTVLRGHQSDVNALQFSPDGRHVITVGDTGHVRAWRTADGQAYWRAPALVGAPPRMFSHRGWERFDSNGRGQSIPAPRQGWASAVSSSTRSVSVSRSGHYLCSRSDGDSVSLWKRQGEKPVSLGVVKALRDVVAIEGACLVLTDTYLERWTMDAHRHRVALAGSPRFVTGTPRGFAVLSGESLHRFDQRGVELGVEPFSDAVGLVHIASWGADDAPVLVKGYADGRLLFTKLEGPRAWRSVEEQVAAAPQVIASGPPGTFVVGFMDGTVGLWDVEQGRLLRRGKLHGSVRHLLLEGRRLYAVTELGAYTVWDLSPFYMARCRLLREVWKDSPGVWRDGRVVQEPPPLTHPCALNSD